MPLGFEDNRLKEREFQLLKDQWLTEETKALAIRTQISGISAAISTAIPAAISTAIPAAISTAIPAAISTAILRGRDLF